MQVRKIPVNTSLIQPSARMLMVQACQYDEVEFAVIPILAIETTLVNVHREASGEFLCSEYVRRLLVWNREYDMLTSTDDDEYDPFDDSISEIVVAGWPESQDAEQLENVKAMLGRRLAKKMKEKEENKARAALRKEGKSA